MCVLYLDNQEMQARKVGGRVRVEKDGNCRANIPIETLESVIIGEKAHLTTPLLFAFMERDISVAYIRHDGRLAGTLGSGISIRRLLAQQDAFSHPVIRPLLVKEILRRKMKGQIMLLRTYAKEGAAQSFPDSPIPCGNISPPLKTITGLTNSVVWRVSPPGSPLRDFPISCALPGHGTEETAGRLGTRSIPF